MEKLHHLTLAEQVAMHERIAIFGPSKVLDEWEHHLTQIPPAHSKRLARFRRTCHVLRWLRVPALLQLQTASSFVRRVAWLLPVAAWTAKTSSPGFNANRSPQRGAVRPDYSPDASASPYPIIGYRHSRIYHRPDCHNYSQVALHKSRV